MIILKTERDMDAMRPACLVAAKVLDDVANFVAPGMATKEIDHYAAAQMKNYGAKSAFLGYRKFPCNICISINDEVVHGLASSRQVEFGDIVSLDVGVFYNGFVGDTAKTIAVGGCSVMAQRLMDVTKESLFKGIDKAVSGNRVADVSRAIQNCIEENGFNVVREFVGHGVGRKVHEDPQVPNFVDGKSSPKLRPGMTLAIEPMVNAGQADIRILNDRWTVVTKDASLSAHFEHTVLITEEKPEILTRYRECRPF